MPRTSREAFLQSPLRVEFAKMAETSAMDAACEYALLALIDELPGENDPNASWTQHSKICGARRVLQILRTIHLPQEVPKPTKLPSLKTLN